MNNRKKYVIIAVTAAILMFIWINSMLPISVSGSISSKIAEILRRIPFMGNVNGELVRKLAHAAEFTVFGAAAAVFFGSGLRSRLPLIGFCGLMTAVIDETIQLFSAGRGSRITDVWIDFAGFSAGVLTAYIIIKIRSKRN